MEMYFFQQSNAFSTWAREAYIYSFIILLANYDDGGIHPNMQYQ